MPAPPLKASIFQMRISFGNGLICFSPYYLTPVTPTLEQEKIKKHWEVHITSIASKKNFRVHFLSDMEPWGECTRVPEIAYAGALGPLTQTKGGPRSESCLVGGFQIVRLLCLSLVWCQDHQFVQLDDMLSSFRAAELQIAKLVREWCLLTGNCDSRLRLY